MKKYLKILFYPLITYLRKVSILLKLQWQNKTLKLSSQVTIEDVKFGRNNFLGENVSIGHVQLGDFSYIAYSTVIWHTRIGKYSCIGPNVKIGLGKHPTRDFISSHPLFYSRMPVVGISFSNQDYFKEYDETVIGNDVWIGANVIIPGGIKIGDGAIIASGSVVSRDVPAYSIVGGVPSNLIRYKFTEQEISRLLDLKWWDFDVELLRQNFKKMHTIQSLNDLENIKSNF